MRGPGDVFTMPTVPTGVQSRVLLYVRNRGFEHIQLNYRLPPHVPVKLTVDFPEGRALGVATFGPSAAAAEIEASKAWSKAFMVRDRKSVV